MNKMNKELIERIEKLIMDYHNIIDSKINMRDHIANTEAGKEKHGLVAQLDNIFSNRFKEELNEETVASLEKQVYENIYLCLLTHFDKRKRLFKFWIEKGYVKDKEHLNKLERFFEKTDRFIEDLSVEQVYKEAEDFYKETEGFMKEYTKWAYENGLTRHDLFTSKQTVSGIVSSRLKRGH